MNVAEAANVNQIAVDEAIDALPDQDPPEVQVIPQYNMFSAGQVIAFTTPNIPVGRWVRDRYFTQDNFNFLLINELPFTILIYVNNMGCLDCHYNTQYLRCTFTRKMSEIYEKHGSWDFIKNGDFYIYEQEQLEVSFKFVAISPDGLCILKDIGPFVQTCCSICVEDMQPTEPVFILGCLHAFHRLCLLNWARNQSGTRTCPNCRGVIQNNASQNYLAKTLFF